MKLDKKLDGLKQRFLNLVTNIQEKEINGEEDYDYDQEAYNRIGKGKLSYEG